MSTCGKLFIREKIGDLRFCEGRRINEDKYFLISYLLSNPGKVVNINQTIYGYYVREGSASNSSFSDKHLDMLYFSEKIENDVVASYPELTKAARYNNIVAHLAVLKKIVRSKGTKANKQLLSDVRKKVLALSKGLTTSELGNHKQEILMLRLGIPVYVLCVRLHDGMKR